MRRSKIDTFLKIFDKYDDLDKLITIALSKANGNRPVAAEKLGISIRTLYRHLQRRRNNNEQR